MTAREKRRWFRGLRFRRTRYAPGFGVCLCDVCLKTAQDASYRFDRRIGDPVEGCQYINRERVFAEHWEKEHEHRDLAQVLMVKPGETRLLWGGRPAFWLTYRERIILATVIQWLGSNIGFHFLREALRACGYELVERRRAEEGHLEEKGAP